MTTLTFPAPAVVPAGKIVAVNISEEEYLTLNPIGTVVSAPFVMRFGKSSFREPDLQIILNDNPGQLTETAMIGPADLCIEVVSEESITRDYGDKFIQYEKTGVHEYWIIDPLREEARFHGLQSARHYVLSQPDESGHYRTALLPDLVLHVPTLWQKPLPDIFETVEAVRKMVEESQGGS